ncbi:MAG: HDOD domain-containing protein [Proteobacteria bacterium]|nr:HDOD domain-containing protein [Pseudomonadota bacterium]
MDRREIFKSIAAEVSHGELSFPTSAQVAMRVRQALDNPGCHIDAAARLVQAEPLLSARVVAIANSIAFNRSGREITDVRSAVARLGFVTVRALATAVVARQLAGAPSVEADRKLAAALWEHTAHVASLAHVIARRVTHQDPETAMFAGIVHEVGGFYLLSRAHDFPGLLEGDPADWIESGEAELGRAVLKVLSVPEPVTKAIEGFWDGYLAMPPTTLGDTLLLADELAPVPSPLHPIGGDQHGEGMKASIDMVIGEETLILILKESAEEVASLTGALNF